MASICSVKLKKQSQRSPNWKVKTFVKPEIRKSRCMEVQVAWQWTQITVFLTQSTNICRSVGLTLIHLTRSANKVFGGETFFEFGHLVEDWMSWEFYGRKKDIIQYLIFWMRFWNQYLNRAQESTLTLWKLEL